MNTAKHPAVLAQIKAEFVHVGWIGWCLQFGERGPFRRLSPVGH